MILQQLRRGLAPILCLGSLATDVLYFGLPLTSLVLAFVVAPVYVVRWLLRLRKGTNTLGASLPLLFKGGLCVLTFGAVMGAIQANGRLAEARAQQIIAAVQEYHAHNGAYPPSLEALTPEFLDQVPACCIRMTLPTFFYDTSADRHELWWVQTPPFDRRGYHFEEQRYWVLD